MSSTVRHRLGIALIVFGLLTIVVSVLAVCEVANGPGTGPKTFAQSRGYNQTKVDLQRSFPHGLLGGLAGLGITMFAARLAKRAPEPSPSA
ncbi:MAG: hypothetical protein EXS08_13545 [Planctomycetes bacterium]|nr:hypothetical protein [Planctomycetota bacterium]